MVDSVEGSLLEERSSTKPPANTLVDVSEKKAVNGSNSDALLQVLSASSPALRVTTGRRFAEEVRTMRAIR